MWDFLWSLFSGKPSAPPDIFLCAHVTATAAVLADVSVAATSASVTIEPDLKCEVSVWEC